jgi:hypothetical protein
MQNRNKINTNTYLKNTNYKYKKIQTSNPKNAEDKKIQI